MKKSLFFLSLLWAGSAGAQVSKVVTGSLPQKGFTVVTVDSTSQPIGGAYFNTYLILPAIMKALHISVQTISTKTGMTTRNPFIIQIVTTKKIWVNQQVEGTGSFETNIPLTSLDSMAVFCIAHPPPGEKTNFYIHYTVGDTAALSYKGQQPEAVFGKMLELAPAGFINLAGNSGGSFATLSYPEGLFAGYKAERSKYNEEVTQYTGEGVGRAAADKLTAEWNKKIKTWLEGYEDIEIKKETKGDVALNGEEEKTTYSKKNKDGVLLFKVIVFKEVKDEGTDEDHPAGWTTGVRITAK